MRCVRGQGRERCEEGRPEGWRAGCWTRWGVEHSPAARGEGARITQGFTLSPRALADSALPGRRSPPRASRARPEAVLLSKMARIIRLLSVSLTSQPWPCVSALAEDLTALLSSCNVLQVFAVG